MPQAELPEFAEGARLKFALKAYNNEDLSTGLALPDLQVCPAKSLSIQWENMGSRLLDSPLKNSERTLRVPEKPVISNTSPLIGLWALNLFPLLQELYTEVLIPEKVRSEFFRGLKARHARQLSKAHRGLELSACVIQKT